MIGRRPLVAIFWSEPNETLGDVSISSMSIQHFKILVEAVFAILKCVSCTNPYKYIFGEIASSFGNKDCVTRLRHHVTEWFRQNVSAAEKSAFCERDLLPLAWTLGFWAFVIIMQTIYMQSYVYNTLKEREKLDVLMLQL